VLQDPWPLQFPQHCPVSLGGDGIATVVVGANGAADVVARRDDDVAGAVVGAAVVAAAAAAAAVVVGVWTVFLEAVAVFALAVLPLTLSAVTAESTSIVVEFAAVSLVWCLCL